MNHAAPLPTEELHIDRAMTSGGELSLTARQGRFAFGGLHARPSPDVLTATDLWGAARQDARLLRTLLDRGRGGVEAEVLQPLDGVPDSTLIAAGLIREGPRLLVERELDDLPPRPAFVAHTMASIGVSAFAEVFEVALNGCREPELARRTPGEWLLRFWRRGGVYLGAERWAVLADERGPVGVVLPALNRATGEGWLSFFGALPERRGQRLGAALHAWGLHTLRDGGAAWYRDATSLTSPEVRRVAASNGCIEVGVTTLWRLPSPVEGA